MTKKEFISYMKERLSILNSDEITDIISEYTQHIDNKLAEGMSEKDAVATLGNVEDVAREILSAYNVNPDYNNVKKGEVKNEVKAVVTSFFDKFFATIKGIGDYILGQKAISLLKLVIKTIIMFFILWICFMAGFGVVNIFASVISSFLNWYFIKDILMMVYIIIALPTAVYIFIRFFAHSVGIDNKIKNKVVKENEPPKTESKTIKMVKEKADKISNTVKDSSYSFMNIIKRIVVFSVKAIVLMCLIPCGITLIFTIIALGALIVMLVLGYPVVGPILGCLGFNMAGISILAIIIKFIFFKRGVEIKNEEVL